MIRRPVAAGPIFTAILSCCVLSALEGAAADGPETVAARPPDAAAAESSNLYRLIKKFDFDERPQGNFEETPMHWIRLTGPGLPLYNGGRFDHTLGASAPPSFELRLIGGGSVAYEYQQHDLAAIAGSDYLIVGRIRVAGLEHSRAFMAVYFVDRFDQPIPGSLRVSNLVAQTGRTPEPWQEVSIELPGDFPAAYALRLQVWVLQAHVWREVDPHEPDPILVQDVLGTAWFDDLAVYRLPRTRLRFSNPACFALVGRPESFIIEVINATPYPLAAELNIRDKSDQVVHRHPLELPAETNRPTLTRPPEAGPAARRPSGPESSESLKTPVPDLPPGVYKARFSVLVGEQPILERELQFAVLAELPGVPPATADLGVDLGPWRGGDAEALRDLLTTMACGAVKVGVPMVGSLNDDQRIRYFRGLAEFARDMAQRQIEVAAVLVSAEAGLNPGRGVPSWQLVGNDALWRRLSSPVLSFFGGMLGTWQLGIERLELAHPPGWRPRDIQAVREHLGRFITLPRLVIPQTALTPLPETNDIVSLLVSGSIPTHALSGQLEHLKGAGPERWLQLEPVEPAGLDRQRRLADLARRVVLAKAAGAQRCFIPAPLELSLSAGGLTWSPTEEYVILRTLFHGLAGQRAIHSFSPAEDVTVTLFSGTSGPLMVLWSWRNEPGCPPLELYLGGEPTAMDLWGRPLPLEMRGDRVRIVPTPAPILVRGLDLALARLGLSFHVAPTQVEIAGDNAEPPVLMFQNTFDEKLTGELEILTPEGWTISPRTLPFSLEPGETLQQKLMLTLLPGQPTRQRDLDVRLALHAPRPAMLDFVVPLTVGLAEIESEVVARWEGERLVVEQVVLNKSGREVSFDAVCDAPRRPRMQGLFLRLPPGERATWVYVFSDARELAGGLLYLSLVEIGGKRRLDQLVEVPP